MDLCEVETTHLQGLPVFNFLWICLGAKLEDLHSDWKFSRARAKGQGGSGEETIGKRSAEMINYEV